MKLTDAMQADILQHAKDEFQTSECCGLIAVVKGRRRYFPCQNIAETPDEHFVLQVGTKSKSTWRSLLLSIASQQQTPSRPADRVACEKSGLPASSTPTPKNGGITSLKALSFRMWGVSLFSAIVDCWTLP